MSKSIMSDAGVGRALFITRLGLSFQALKLCFWFGAIPGLFLPLLAWYVPASPHDVGMVKLDVMSRTLSENTPRVWKVANDKGVRSIVSVVLEDGREKQLLTPYQIRSVLEPYWLPVRIFYRYLFAGIVISIIAYLFVWVSLKKLGRTNQEDQRVRGADYVTDVITLNRMVKKAGAGPYRLGGAFLPEKAPMMGILAIGSPGSGKSSAIHDLFMQVFREKRKMIIYDQSGEYFRSHFRPGIDVFSIRR